MRALLLLGAMLTLSACDIPLTKAEEDARAEAAMSVNLPTPASTVESELATEKLDSIKSQIRALQNEADDGRRRGVINKALFYERHVAELQGTKVYWSCRTRYASSYCDSAGV